MNLVEKIIRESYEVHTKEFITFFDLSEFINNSEYFVLSVTRNKGANYQLEYYAI